MNLVVHVKAHLNSSWRHGITVSIGEVPVTLIHISRSWRGAKCLATNKPGILTGYRNSEINMIYSSYTPIGLSGKMKARATGNNKIIPWANPRPPKWA